MLCSPLDWQYAELPSSASDAVLCTVLVCKMWSSNQMKKYLLICEREAESNLSFAKSVIAHHNHNLRTSDENDLEHVMNTDNSIKTCPFASFRPTTSFYNFSFTSMNKRRRVIKTKEN